MQIEKKDAAVSAADDTFPGSFEVILSAPTKDRDGETLRPEDWKTPLPDHITFDVDHGMDVASTVGSGVPRLDEKSGQLIVAGTFSALPRAQEVRQLVREGHIKTTSVAFMREKSTKDGVTVERRELLNGAFVAIPSNREALVLSAKAADLKVGARNNGTDSKHIQAIHDHAAALGAKHGNETDDVEDGQDGGSDDDAEKPKKALRKAAALLAELDATTLPAEVRQAVALITASAADEATDETDDQSVKSAAAAQAAAADETEDAATTIAILARSISLRASI